MIRAVGVRDGHTVRLDVHGVAAPFGLHLYIIWYGHGAQVDTLIDIPVDAETAVCPVCPWLRSSKKAPLPKIASAANKRIQNFVCFIMCSL